MANRKRPKPCETCYHCKGCDSRGFICKRDFFVEGVMHSIPRTIKSCPYFKEVADVKYKYTFTL